MKPQSKYRSIGKNIQRRDVLGKIKGDAKFCADLDLKDMDLKDLSLKDKSLKNPLTLRVLRSSRYHAEIENPSDKLPTEMSCEELLHSEPQLYFTNATVAVFICQMFYYYVIKNNYYFSELYFDMTIMSTSAKHRKTKNRE